MEYMYCMCVCIYIYMIMNMNYIIISLIFNYTMNVIMEFIIGSEIPWLFGCLEISLTKVIIMEFDGCYLGLSLYQWIFVS